MKNMLEDFKTCIAGVARELEDTGSFKNRHELGLNSQKFLNGVLRKELDDSEWPTALFQLTRVLRTLHNKRVMVLVDEYDTPISYAVQHGYFPEVRPIHESKTMYVLILLFQANLFFRRVFSPLLKVGIFDSSPSTLLMNFGNRITKIFVAPFWWEYYWSLKQAGCRE